MLSIKFGRNKKDIVKIIQIVTVLAKCNKNLECLVILLNLDKGTFLSLTW